VLAGKNACPEKLKRLQVEVAPVKAWL